jgi:hypothetical protein
MATVIIIRFAIQNLLGDRTISGRGLVALSPRTIGRFYCVDPDTRPLWATLFIS